MSTQPERQELEALFKECAQPTNAAVSELQRLKPAIDQLDPELGAALAQVQGLLIKAAYPYETLKALMLNPEADPRHHWKCISTGMYDFTYQCQRCGRRHTESIDNPGSEPPTYGCPGTPTTGD